MTNEFLKSLGATVVIGLLAYFLVEVELHKWVIAGVVKAGNYVWAVVVTLAIMAIGGILYAAFSHFGTLKPGGSLDRVMKSVRDATEETGFQLKDNFTQKIFWIYMGMLGILTFVKLTFYLFHVMFPTYATRVFGYDFPVAGVFGTLNPAMIVFLVPLISALTVNIRSYTMLMVGTAVSAGAFSFASYRRYCACNWRYLVRYLALRLLARSSGRKPRPVLGELHYLHHGLYGR